MGWFTRTATATPPRPATAAPEIRSVPAPGTLASVFYNASALVNVTEARALRVPAFSKGMSLITGTSAKLPLVHFDGPRQIDGVQLLAQPEPDVIPWVTYQRTFQDVGLHSKAYWLVVDVDEAGYPQAVKRLPASEVIERPDEPNHVFVGDKRLPLSIPSMADVQRPSDRFYSLGKVIRFDGYEMGILDRGRDTLQTAIYLEATAARYAKRPLPNIALRNTGVDFDADQIEELLTAWDAAREDEEDTSAFLQGPIEVEKFGWNAAEIQLVEARNQSAVQISRLLNLDPFHVGASLEGTSLTYGNRTDIRSDLIDFTLSDYLTPVQQRLSMRDVTRPGMVSRFDTTDFTRSSLEARVEMVATLTPLLDSAGEPVLTAAEARDLLTYAPLVKGVFA